MKKMGFLKIDKQAYVPSLDFVKLEGILEFVNEICGCV